MWLTRLLADPRAFIRRQAKYPGIRTQGAIVVAAGIAFGLTHLGNAALLGEAAGHVTGSLWILPLGAILIAFGIWVSTTIIIYYLARVFDAYFSPGVLFRMTGWGMVPMVAAGAIQSLAELYVLMDADPPEEPPIAGFEAEHEMYLAYLEQAVTEPLFLLATALALPFVLASAYLWAAIVEELGETSRVESFVVVALPAIICLVWVLWPLF